MTSTAAIENPITNRPPVPISSDPKNGTQQSGEIAA